MGLFKKLFGTYSDRELKRLRPLVDQVFALESQYRALSESDLRGKTAEFRARLEQGESMDDLLPEAFATVIEAADRVLGMRHYRCQVIGGIVLHQGRIAEMKTGEGKTLVATLPIYLNALGGRGVHLVTVNDYLARFHSEWMGKVYRYLGLSVGLIVHGLSTTERRAAYAADITYGTNNEFGFDYLRDNMVTYGADRVQRELIFAIVDEVDSILIDEARTPLIISGQGDESTDMYQRADRFARQLRAFVVAERDDKMDHSEISADADYIVDEKARTATLTERGVAKAEQHFKVQNLADEENYSLQHYINNALKAYGTMRLDDQYVIKDGEIVIVDDFTGRLMFGRRYSDGLHQAIEAKEGVHVRRESKTLATITFQNYFRMYNKLSGMTGTAQTEEEEFRDIYSLDVVQIPTNRPVIREDLADVVYKTIAGKTRALTAEVQAAHKRGQPVLIGTVSVEKSEQLSSIFRRLGIPHNVLNAKQHEREAEIVAQAGRYGAVTIATNMAGRGTDIILGGNPELMARQELRKLGYPDDLIDEADAHNETTDQNVLDIRKKFTELVQSLRVGTQADREKVLEVGGLYIIGTERHESRRIDNQLRGRAGRQGDPGMSRFYLALEDDLMRLFGGERLQTMFENLGVDEDMPIEARILTGAIESAQRKVEGRNFGIRKHVLEYDDVMNQQREVIYGQRRQVLEGEDLHGYYLRTIEEVIGRIVHSQYAGISDSSELDTLALSTRLADLLGPLDVLVDLRSADGEVDMSADELADAITSAALANYEAREAEMGSKEFMREAERVVLLRVVDQHWMDHIDAMDDLRGSIGMRSYGQHDPVIEYKREGLEMFDTMTESIQEGAVRLMMRAKFSGEAPPERRQAARETGATKADADQPQVQAQPAAPRRQAARRTVEGRGAAPGEAQAEKRVEPVRRDNRRVGRNDPCPCGSGKKYKNCHGR
ncbi:MAG: preprotein translocase subunit SecA [Bacillota bacterium]|nr:preprotein translocase subunit SecA [Bacillota bacterium]